MAVTGSAPQVRPYGFMSPPHVCVGPCFLNVVWVCGDCLGPGTSLLCEYLSPWVLFKELQTALRMNGLIFLRSPEFRVKCPVIFWNLVLYSEKFHLPLECLV